MIPNKIVTIFISIVLTVGAIYLSILSWNAFKAHDYIGVSEEQRHSIIVTGEGKVVGVPDVANISLGYVNEKRTVAAAQKESTEKMNALVEKLKKEFNIDEKDIKTANYSISPRYDWQDGQRILRGYEINQSLNVKIRELDKASEILEAAGELNLNQIGNLAFEIDEEESLKQEAREKAIEAAKEKAEALAKVTGVKLGRIINFSESDNSLFGRDDYSVSYKMLQIEGAGGGIAPEIEAGSTEIKIIATVEYEIL